MQQAIDEAGNIWPVDAQGNVTGPSLGNVNQQRGGMQIKPADPTRQYEGPQAGASLESTTLTNQQKRQELLDAQRGKLPTGYRWGANGQAELIPGVPAPKDPNKQPLTAAERANAISGYQSSLALDKVISQLEEQYRRGPGSTSGLGGIWDYLPTEANNRFDSTGNAARGTVGQALGFTGGQLNSVQEAEMSVGPYLPQSSDKDGVILDKIARLKQVRDDARARSIAMLGGVPDANGNVTPIDPMQGATVLPQAAGAQAAAPMQVGGVTSKGGLIEIPQLRGIENQVSDMIGRGASTEQVVGFLRQAYAPYGAEVGPELQGYLGDIVRKHQANPRQPVKSLGTGWENLYYRKAPDTAEANTFMGINPDSDFGTGVMTAANAATGGLPAYLAGKQNVVDAAAQERPGPAMAGEIGGGALAMLGINKAAGAAGRLGTALTRAGGVGGDALYGGVRGGLEGGPGGAVVGALAGAAGNKLGGGVVSGTGAAVRGVSSPAVRYLADKGIPLTVGQMLGNRGVIGRTMNKLESVPILGDALQQRRIEGLRAYGEEAGRQAVDPINGPAPGFGADGVANAQRAVSQAYDNAYGGINLTPDQQFAQEAGAAVQQGRSIPVMGDQFDYIMANKLAPLGQGGMIDGPRLQAAIQSLKGARANFSKEGAMGVEAADAVSGVESAINNMVARQAPGAMPAIEAANQAYRNTSVLGDAVMSNADGMVTPANLRRAAINNTKKFGGRNAAARGDTPFADLINYGQDVLPSTIPNSGTADRGMASLLVPATLGGGAVGAQQLGEPKIAVPLAALALLSSKNGAKVAQKVLTGRSDAARAIGVAIRRQKRKGGLFGSALATGSVVPQLSQ